MSWSLQLHNGDFALSGSQLGVVTDQNKLTQDLRCALAERMGTDDMHPEFGSLIDGGRLPDGSVVSSPIGTTNVQQVTAMLQSEIERVARGYMTQQLNRARADRLTYNRVSLTAGEALLSITNVEVSQTADTLTVNVTLQTGQGQDISLVIPVLTQ